MLKKFGTFTASTGLALLLTACGGGSSGGDDSENPVEQGSPEEENTNIVTAATETLVLPEQLSVVTQVDDSVGIESLHFESNMKNAFFSIQSFDDEETDYTEDEQSIHIWNEALQPVDLVNNILCFTEQFRANEFVNEGPYNVLANDTRCFEKGEGDSGESGQSSGASNTPSYINAVVDVERETSTSPLVISVWMPEMDAGDDGSQAIKFKAVIREGASDENPFGDFTFNFDFYDNFDDENQYGGGEVQTIDVDGAIGFTLYETSQRGADEFAQSASVVVSEDQSEGNAVTAQDWGQWGGAAFALAFNEDNVLVQDAEGIDDLPYLIGDDSGTCLSRTDFNEAVWRYDLYDVDSGDRVEINSGFPFKYDSDDDAEPDAHGYISYYGLWSQEEGALENGDTIWREEEGDDSEYTVVTAPGRLIKNSIESLSLDNISGVAFSNWDGSAYESGFDQWVVNYLTVADDSVAQDGFYRVGGLSWGENGQDLTLLETPQLITLESFEVLYMYSNQLGGNVQFLAGDDKITFFAQTYINGSETGTGEELESGSLSLVCYERCPIGTLDGTALADFDSPYSSDASTLGEGMAFSFANSGSDALTLIRTSNSQAVKYADGLSEEDLANSPYAWGIHSGAMVTSDVAATLSNPWDIYNSELVTVFYTWETGLNDWNQLQVVRDEEGDIVTFEQPLEFTYTHSQNNDRAGDDSYAGQTYFVGYGGNGNFWGIPYEETSSGRWYPQFNIDDGVVMGPTNQYAIKAREIEQSMAEASGQCTALELEDPVVPVPTETEGSADIGAMPEVDDDPAVIDGVIQ